MKPFRFLLAALFLGPFLQGCSHVNPSKTQPQEASLLDDKVSVQRVEAALQRAGPQFNQVHVSAQGNDVILSGSVSSPEYRSRAEMIAQSVHRQFKVENNLQVRQ